MLYYDTYKYTIIDCDIQRISPDRHDVFYCNRTGLGLTGCLVWNSTRLGSSDGNRLFSLPKRPLEKSGALVSINKTHFDNYRL